jgi:hypothetical protein
MKGSHRREEGKPLFILPKGICRSPTNLHNEKSMIKERKYPCGVRLMWLHPDASVSMSDDWKPLYGT